MIPNILTTVRLCLVPVFAYLMLSGKLIAGGAVFLISGIIDIVDGFIARRFNMITDFGKIYDPFVDKTMQITALVCLVILKIIPWWLLAIICLKEITMIVCGAFLYSRKVVVSSNWYGKLSTVIFYIAVLSMIVFKNVMTLPIKSALIAVMIVTMVFTAVSYLVDIIKNFDEKRIEPKK